MEAISLIFSSIALCGAAFSILLQLGIIDVRQPKTDKYEKYRNIDGLLGRKKND